MTPKIQVPSLGPFWIETSRVYRYILWCMCLDLRTNFFNTIEILWLYHTLPNFVVQRWPKAKKHDKIRVITVSISCAVYYKRMVAEQQNSVAQIGFRVLSPWLRCRLASWPGWFSNRDPGALGEESTLLGGWAPSGLKLLRFTPHYKPWSSAIWKGSHNPRGLTITMVINH